MSIFTKEDGQRMVFQLPAIKEKTQYKKIIKDAGGKLTSKNITGCVRLATKKMKVTSKDYVAITFIDDCLRRKKLLDIEEYRITPSNNIGMSDKDDDLFSDAHDTVTAGAVKELKGRQRYMTSDDEDILKFLIEDKRYKYYKGNRVWKMAEDLKITTHTWQSMMDRYKKHILPHIQMYGISDKYKCKLKSVEHNKKRNMKKIQYQLPLHNATTPPKKVNNPSCSKDNAKIETSNTETSHSSNTTDSSKHKHSLRSCEPRNDKVVTSQSTLKKSTRSQANRQSDSMNDSSCDETLPELIIEECSKNRKSKLRSHHISVMTPPKKVDSLTCSKNNAEIQTRLFNASGTKDEQISTTSRKGDLETDSNSNTTGNSKHKRGLQSRDATNDKVVTAQPTLKKSTKSQGNSQSDSMNDSSCDETDPELIIEKFSKKRKSKLKLRHISVLTTPKKVNSPTCSKNKIEIQTSDIETDSSSNTTGNSKHNGSLRSPDATNDSLVTLPSAQKTSTRSQVNRQTSQSDSMKDSSCDETYPELIIERCSNKNSATLRREHSNHLKRKSTVTSKDVPKLKAARVTYTDKSKCSDTDENDGNSSTESIKLLADVQLPPRNISYEKKKKKQDGRTDISSKTKQVIAAETSNRKNENLNAYQFIMSPGNAKNYSKDITDSCSIDMVNLICKKHKNKKIHEKPTKDRKTNKQIDAYKFVMSQEADLSSEEEEFCQDELTQAIAVLRKSSRCLKISAANLVNMLDENEWNLPVILHKILPDNYKHKWTAAEDKMLTHGSNVNMELLREKFDDDQINAHASMLAVRKLRTIANK